MEKKDFDIKKIIGHFAIDGAFVSAEPYGNGHINDTFAVSFTNGRIMPPYAAALTDAPFKRALMQRINQNVFKEPGKLMENVDKVTRFLKDKIVLKGGDYLRETLNLIPTRDGGCFYLDQGGNYWRVYLFIENCDSYEIVKSGGQMYKAGRAFGNFQKLLSDFPAHLLHESIPNFHHTPKRYETFLDALKQDKCGRAKDVEKETAFIKNRKDDCRRVQDLIDAGDLPLRVTHNDTKINNVMFDSDTKQPVCVVDLDTIMPGSMLFDFGDSVRFGANPAAEDERDLSKVYFKSDYYDEFRRGFTAELGDSMTELENRLLPMGAKLMTLENGIRFLTDHLNGDVYFKIHRPYQNLDRARTQFKLVEGMEEYFGNI